MLYCRSDILMTYQAEHNNFIAQRELIFDDLTEQMSHAAATRRPKCRHQIDIGLCIVICHCPISHISQYGPKQRTDHTILQQCEHYGWNALLLPRQQFRQQSVDDDVVDYTGSMQNTGSFLYKKVRYNVTVPIFYSCRLL